MRETALPLLVLALTVSLAEASDRPFAAPSTAATIDFEGFLRASEEVLEVRSDRLLPLDEFLALAAEPGTVLLDTRSESAYRALHLAGAVHLNFSDLTKRSLRRKLGARDRTVLIYCNNNFTGDRNPLVTKAPAAALNISTFVSLWSYGYRNVYELGELLDPADGRVEFEGQRAGGAR